MLSLSACDQEDDEAGSPDASPTEAITPGEDEDGATEEETTPEEETASEEEETTPEEETAPADEESTDNGEGAEDEEGAQDEEGAEDGEDADAGAGAGGVTETEVITDPIFGTDGYPTADWSITDRTGEPAFGCWAESGAALEGLAYLCGASADYGVACLANRWQPTR